MLNGIVLGEISFEPLFHETGIPLAVMGMLVVFVALGILMTIISAMPRVMAIIEGKPLKTKSKSRGDGKKISPEAALALAPIASAPAGSSSPDAPTLDEPSPEGLSAELVAVIAAAAEFELGPVRVVRMRPLTPSELAWTLEGRLRHHASHHLQPRNR
jgi:Na+-transporting methylmalonyl-CoA/oxaloacetate decarboxylase gamma subunit